MPQLISPTPCLHQSWLEARDEWGRGTHQDGSGLHESDEVDSPEGFHAWVRRLHREADSSVPPEQGRVHSSYFWIVEDDCYLGAIALRHVLNAFLLEAGGHIGYGVRPSARRRGLGTWALASVLPKAKALGLSEVLVTCDETNTGSQRVIEANGGVMEDIRDTPLGRTRRYWISLGQVT
ncbi:MAG TPA: GNAT family N-acetyltransferase [Nocardioidaceae bacterium]|nr:GNAT family N-acetyltransferase [Nocardioidaceae bacterium]